MSKSDDMRDAVRKEVEVIELKTFVKWNRKVCTTAVTAVFSVGAMIGNWLMNHSERAYAAMHVLVFGEMPK